MSEFVKPKIIISACLGFDNCRYDAEPVGNSFVKNLSRFVELKPVCPEVKIGLGVPRDPIRIVKNNNNLILIQPSTNKDLTKKIQNFSKNYLKNLKDIDGFILKSKSPSCGIKNAKIFSNSQTDKILLMGNGFFAESVSNKFPNIPIEDEERLDNFGIRKHFLERIFLYANFRNAIKSKSISNLIEFHSKNKLLLMSYNQSKLKTLGNIVGNNGGIKISELITTYEEILNQVLIKLPNRGSNINVMLHGFGYVSKFLKSDEKSSFLKLLDSYKNGKIPLSDSLSLLKSWINKFDQQYLMQQTFFNPYPEELMK